MATFHFYPSAQNQNNNHDDGLSLFVIRYGISCATAVMPLWISCHKFCSLQPLTLNPPCLLFYAARPGRIFVLHRTPGIGTWSGLSFFMPRFDLICDATQLSVSVPVISVQGRRQVLATENWGASDIGR